MKNWFYCCFGSEKVKVQLLQDQEINPIPENTPLECSRFRTKTNGKVPTICEEQAKIPEDNKSLSNYAKNHSLSELRNSLSINNQRNSISDNKSTNLDCFLCGGEHCKDEDWLNCESPSIEGLNSNLIFPGIFASQRPSSCLVEKFKLIDKFKEFSVN